MRLIDILVDELKLTSTFVGDIASYPDGATVRRPSCDVADARTSKLWDYAMTKATRMGSQLFNSQINTNKVPRRKT